MNLAFCGYLLLLACSDWKRSHLPERGGMRQQEKSTSCVAKLLCFDVLQSVLKHAVSKLKHVTKVHAVHNMYLCTEVLSYAFLLLINKSVVSRFCAVSKITLYTVWLLLVFSRFFFQKVNIWIVVMRAKSTWIQLLYLFLIKNFLNSGLPKASFKDKRGERGCISMRNKEEMFLYSRLLNTSCGMVQMCSNSYCRKKTNQ